ncbi:MAG: DUF2891 family protein, partial [Sphingopyxis sp.]
MTGLTADHAAHFMAVTLGHLGREYPHKLDHVLTDDGDAVPPRALHPIFYGSFDWHSCVHGWWQVLRLARLFPQLPVSATVRARADALFTPANIAAERAYLARPASSGFERPYGWAWALALHDEAARHDAPWAADLAPFARDFAARFAAFLPKQTYPIRVGTHYNSAFAITLSLDWADAHDAALAAQMRACAQRWFMADR